MRRLIIFSIMLFSVILVQAQEEKKFVFQDNLADTARLKLNYNFAGNHYLGPSMANKLYRVQETYTYVEKGTPMSPSDKTIVQKPSIFYAIKKINKYYKKQVKKGHIDKATAYEELGRILDVAYVLYHQDTDDFEKYLKQHKKPEQMIEAFAMVELE